MDAEIGCYEEGLLNDFSSLKEDVVSREAQCLLYLMLPCRRKPLGKIVQYHYLAMSSAIIRP